MSCKFPRSHRSAVLHHTPAWVTSSPTQHSCHTSHSWLMHRVEASHWNPNKDLLSAYERVWSRPKRFYIDLWVCIIAIMMMPRVTAYGNMSWGCRPHRVSKGHIVSLVDQKRIQNLPPGIYCLNTWSPQYLRNASSPPRRVELPPCMVWHRSGDKIRIINPDVNYHKVYVSYQHVHILHKP